MGYWKLVNHQNYVERLDKDNTLKYLSDDDIKDFSSDVDVEQVTETAMLILLLRSALDKLSDDERKIIDEIFFSDEKQSMRKSAEKIGTSHQALGKRLKKILAKLKRDIEDKLH